MPASDHVHPQQLRLFMPAKELHTAGMVSEGERDQSISATKRAWRASHPDSSDDDFDEDTNVVYETPDELWDRKLAESKRSAPFDISRHEQISKHGILRPVVLTGGQIRDGYHRVAIANDLNPDTEVPVEHKTRSEPHDFKG